MSRLMENFGLTGHESYPVVIGEFGAFKFAYRNPAAGAAALMDWQVASCRYGVDGWFHWHFTGTNDREVWTGSEADDAINVVLSPRARPNPCRTAAFAFIERNLASGARVRASSFAKDGPPRRAADGAFGTIWQSGAGPSQWIEFTLSAPSTLRTIRLTVAQYPAGSTTHVVLVGSSEASLHRVHVFRGPTKDGQTLTWTPGSALRGIRVVRILTTRSPSFVAWREIELIGGS
jgi:hypothetical protein